MKNNFINFNNYIKLNNYMKGNKHSLIYSAYSMHHKKKVILKNIKNVNFNTNELAILNRLNNYSSIVNLLDNYKDDTSTTLVFENYKNGDLYDCLYEERNPLYHQDEILNLFYKILQPVQLLHNNNIVHLDLKLENYFVDDNSIVLGDFGTSRIHDTYYYDEYDTQVIGTRSYTAPEILVNKFSKASDIWSCGVMLYYILKDDSPIVDNINTLYNRNEEIVIHKNVSNDLKYLLDKLLSIDHLDRPTINEILNYPIIKQYKDYKVNSI